jgi:hypothetical protein
MRGTAIRSRARGTSLYEMTVAATILCGDLALALPAMKSISDAGDDGRARTWARGDNRQALLRVARDAMNGSLTAADAMGDPRFEIQDGDARQSLSGDLGFTSTTTSSSTTTSGSSGASGGSGGIGSASNYYGSTDGPGATGSGARGGTHIGRARSDGAAAEQFDAGASRPREAYFARDSVLRFQKIRDYTWGSDGQPVIEWSGWVEYRVRNRNLLKIEDGRETVVSPNTSGFRVLRTGANTVQITLVTERRVAGGGGVASQANHVEVVPKN